MNEKNPFKRILNSKFIQKVKGIKNIEIIIAVALCLFAVIIYFSVSVGGKKAEAQSVQTADAATELESVLSEIKGAGKVRVLITYDGNSEIIPAESVNSSSTVTAENGTVVEKKETKSSVVISSNGSPSVLKTVSPKIVGVIVVAQGAGSPEVEVALLSAVQIATKVGYDKIKVFQMEQ